MAPVDSASSPSPAVPSSKAASPSRTLVAAALLALLGFVVYQGKTLWEEWSHLQKDMAVVRSGAVIGYQNIHPNPSYANKPENWFHDEGEFTLLWSGWRQGDGHRWFRVGRGEVDPARISLPVGRDVIQAIDYPVVETGGGEVWKRIPNESTIVGRELAGIMSAYPLLVLDKVCVVNDLIADHPFLILYNPFVPRESAVQIYDSSVEGRRVTLGMSGYFHDRKPLLYDRGTESLWVQADEGTLQAIAGARKGTRLRPIGRPALMTWGDWRWQHPKSRLVVGADRSKGLPSL